MNHALLNELQGLSAYPSVTLLHSTRPAASMEAAVARLLIGDRHRLVEIHDRRWPLRRGDEESTELWRSRVGEAVASEQRSFEIPTVLGGVSHTIGSLVDVDAIAPIGRVPGNQDATSPGPLHAAAWPIVHDWLERDHAQALARLQHARGARVFAGGIDEIWDLAGDGRVELLVVEDDYHLTARVGGPHLAPATGAAAPHTTDDVVDELIEIVLRSGGETVIVPPGELAEHDRIAAVLRY